MLRSLIALLSLFAFAGALPAQQTTGSIRGQVADDSGAVIPGAKITAVGPGGVQKTAVAGDDGTYALTGLTPGAWSVTAASPGLKQIAPVKVNVSAGTSQSATLTLTVVLENQEVTVKENTGPEVSVSPENNAGSIELKGTDLQALSDDPDELADDLQALAGPSAGPDGGQIFIDGFTGGQLPPKDSIREIRINQNPFSSEYDKLGYGRIEIFTKPGTDQWHGQGFLNASDIAFDARNPYSATEPSFQSQQFGGNVSGSLSKKTSFFLDVQRRNIDDAAVVNAIVLSPSLTPTPFNQTLPTPQRRTEISPRIDYQLSPNNTLMFRYSYERNDAQNSGVNGFSLPSQAFSNLNTENRVQVTDTIVLNPKTINETRFQYLHDQIGENVTNNTPTLNVVGAFTSGGSPVGASSDLQNHWELQNYTSYVSGTHTIKFGGRMRSLTDDNISRNGYNGTFTFSSIGRYQQTLLLEQQGLSAEAIQQAGFGPSQFTMNAGIPQSSVFYIDAGLFVQDDWRLRPNLTLSMGLRYEIQNNIGDTHDWAPRFGFAWAPGQSKGGGRPKTVIRGGFGIFYTRFDESYTLQAERYNGIAQQQYIVNYPTFFPNIPPISQLPLVNNQNIDTVANNLQSPYIMQSAITVERQLPLNTTLSATFTDSHGLHLLRSRDINAPLPGTFVPGVADSGVYPFGGYGQINQFESAGLLNQEQIMVNFNSRINSNVFLFGGYSYNNANSNTDGAGTFPNNTYNLQSEYGPAGIDIHHRVFFGGSVNTKWNVRFSPFIIYHSSQPFDIILGRDLYGDGYLNTARPAFAGTQTGPNIVDTPYGAFNLAPGPNDQIIPRNYGNGPAYFTLNMRLSKTFGFGGERATGGSGGGGGGGGGGGHDHGGGPMGGGMRGMFGDVATGRKYNVTVGVQARNLLNSVNPGQPVAILTSPVFGQSISSAGGFGATNAINRRIEFQIRFLF